MREERNQKLLFGEFFLLKKKKIKMVVILILSFAHTHTTYSTIKPEHCGNLNPTTKTPGHTLFAFFFHFSFFKIYDFFFFIILTLTILHRNEKKWRKFRDEIAVELVLLHYEMLHVIPPRHFLKWLKAKKKVI